MTTIGATVSEHGNGSQGVGSRGMAPTAPGRMSSLSEWLQDNGVAVHVELLPERPHSVLAAEEREPRTYWLIDPINPACEHPKETRSARQDRRYGVVATYRYCPDCRSIRVVEERAS